MQAIRTIFVALTLMPHMGQIYFLVLVFFSLLSDAFAFFVSLYREIAFRLY